MPGIYKFAMDRSASTIWWCSARHTCAGTLIKFADYYNTMRIHRSLDKDAPFHRPIERLGVITSRPILGGLHHQYCRV